MTRAIGPLLTPQERAQFIAQARKLLGVRFRHMGRSARGVDCAGMLLVAMLAAGRPIADSAAYGREPHDQILRGMLVENLGEPIADKRDLRVGDVPLMVFDGEPSHCALIGDYLYGGLSVIHAYATVRKVVEHRLDDTWRDRIVEVWRP